MVTAHRLARLRVVRFLNGLGDESQSAQVYQKEFRREFLDDKWLCLDATIVDVVT